MEKLPKYRNNVFYENIDLRTEKQWQKNKMKIKDSQKNEYTLLWANGFAKKKSKYYYQEQVEPMTKEDLDKIKLERKLKREAKIKRDKEIKEAEEKEKKEHELMLQKYTLPYLSDEQIQEIKKQIYEYQNVPAIDVKNESKIIVIDVETTGLDVENDDIIQISIIDGTGNILMNEYVQPFKCRMWAKAYDIHGITKDTLCDKPYIYTHIPSIKGIFDSAEIIVVYNESFDITMLECYAGINIDRRKVYDVMTEFAPIYHEYSEYLGDFKWQTLSTCACYYGYNQPFKSHDSLEDAKATLFCYKQIEQRS